MNRKERRHMEKRMGLIKHKQGQNFKDRMIRLSENHETAKKKTEAMVDTRRRQTQESNDNEMSAEISSLATTLMIQDGLSYIAALEKAREIHKTKASS